LIVPQDFDSGVRGVYLNWNDDESGKFAYLDGDRDLSFI
jgi:hypothetical protein